jgi:hypothetical protein
MPNTLASRVNSPKNSAAPMSVNPQMFIKSTILKTLSLETIQLKKPEKTQLEFCRYPAEVQLGISILETPSYRKCQPMAIRKITKSVFCNVDKLSDFIFGSSP